MSTYTDYKNLLESVYGTYTPKTYKPSFDQFTNMIQEHLGPLKELYKPCSVTLIPDRSKEGFRWVTIFQSFSPEEGFDLFFLNPVKINQVYSMCEKYQLENIINSDSSKMFLSDLTNMTGYTPQEINQKARFMSLSFEGRLMITYLPRNKYERVSPWQNSARFLSNLMVTEALGKFLVKNFSLNDAQVEELVDKTKYTLLGGNVKLSIVSGDDIYKWYLENNYSQKHNTGDLGNSCMRYFKMQEYLDIYAKNPDQVQMIIATINDKLVGRTLIWTATDGNKYRDRIYGSRIIQWLIMEWANKKKIRTREELYKQKVQLSQWEFRKYPYIDSVRFLDLRSGEASYHATKNSTHIANSTNGTITRV